MRARYGLLFVLALTLALGILLGAHWLYSRYAMPPAARQVSCDLGAQPCHVRLPDGGEMRVEITPRPIQALAPLTIEVSLMDTSLAPNEIRLDFSGIDMEMGINRTRLRKTAPGRFHGQGTLPVCMTGRMRWQATFILEGRKPFFVSFPFESATPSRSGM
jgi:hypothetical protein